VAVIELAVRRRASGVTRGGSIRIFQSLEKSRARFPMFGKISPRVSNVWKKEVS
jgi:hypothetical protein